MGSRSKDVSRRARAKCRRETAGSDCSSRLIEIAIRLNRVYVTGLAVELALRQQNADHDTDLANCLRAGVCAPVSELTEAVRSIVERHSDNRSSLP
jgi:hypothetical protein